MSTSLNCARRPFSSCGRFKLFELLRLSGTALPVSLQFSDLSSNPLEAWDQVGLVDCAPSSDTFSLQFFKRKIFFVAIFSAISALLEMISTLPLHPALSCPCTARPRLSLSSRSWSGGANLRSIPTIPRVASRECSLLFATATQTARSRISHRISSSPSSRLSTRCPTMSGPSGARWSCKTAARR